MSSRVRKGVTFARGFGARAVELFPWTWLGLGVAFGAAAALRFVAFDQLDLVLLVVGYACVGLLALSTLSVVLAALWLALRRLPSDDTTQVTETGSPRDTGFSLPALRWVPLLQLDWSWREPEAHVDVRPQRGRLFEQVRFAHRGEVRGVTRRLVVQDAFGLCRIVLRRRDPRAFDVLPHVGALRGIPTLASLSGGDDLPHPHGLDAGDRIELARYMPGDPARLIHWKIFGRTGKLMVRRPERALAPARRVAAFLVVGDRDEASAAAARVAIEQRMLGNDWVFGADVDVSGVSDARRALDVIVRSPVAREASGASAHAFFERASRQGPVHAIVFAPAVIGDWLPHVEVAARARRLHVVIGTDGIDRAPRLSWWRRLLFAPAPAQALAVQELDRVVAALSQAGCSVTVVDRVGGHVLGERHLSGMRDLSQPILSGAA